MGLLVISTAWYNMGHGIGCEVRAAIAMMYLEVIFTQQI
jgi:hypothetical protein